MLTSTNAQEEDDELRGLAGLTIANCVENPRNRRMFRFYGGIDKAVAILSTAVGAQTYVCFCTPVLCSLCVLCVALFFTLFLFL